MPPLSSTSAKRRIDGAAAPIGDRAGKRRGRDVARDRGDRDRGRDADEDQQRRHQEAAADAEHAGDESDRRAHRQDEENIDRNVGDREVELHAAVDAFGVQHREIVHRLGVALIGALQIELPRLVEVLLYALALLVKAAQAIERGRKALLGGALEPLHCQFQICRDAAAFGVAQADLVFGRRIPRGRRVTQCRATDCGRKLLRGNRRGC
jgi:hypothetical protein